MKLEGIHHISAITGDAAGNVEFYTGVLGLRMVKRTVNQDEPNMYHLFYGDEHGSPGMDLTFFEYPGAARGVAGAGMVHRIVWRVGSPEALEFWEERLAGRGVRAELSGGSLLFADPEGLEHELVHTRVADEPLRADSPEIPREHALQGFEGVRAYSNAPVRSERLLGDALGFSRGEGEHWEVRGAHRGGFYAYDPAPPEINRSAGRGHGAPRGVRRRDRRPGELAQARGRGGRPPDARDRTLLLQIGVLPGAERRAVRDRDDRPRLRRRRGRGPPRREPVAAPAVRADARAARAHARAAALPARVAGGSSQPE